MVNIPRKATRIETDPTCAPDVENAKANTQTSIRNRHYENKMEIPPIQHRMHIVGLCDHPFFFSVQVMGVFVFFFFWGEYVLRGKKVTKAS